MLNDAAPALPRPEPIEFISGTTERWLTPTGIIMALLAIGWTLTTLQNPALGDYVNHLARLHINNALETSPYLKQYYANNDGFYPYHGMDVIVLPLAHFMDIATAGRIFIALAALTPILSSIVLYRVLWGRLSFWPLTAALFVFGYHFTGTGTLPYCFTLGISMLGFAGWVAARDLAWRYRFPLFVAVAALVFWLHGIVLLSYGALIGFYELGRVIERPVAQWRRQIPNLVSSALTLIPAASLFLLIGNKETGNTPLVWGSWAEHGWRMLSPLYPDYADSTLSNIEIWPLALFIVFLAVIAAGLRSGEMRLHPSMRLPIAGIALMAMLSPVAFFNLADQGTRFPIILYLLLAGSIAPTIAKPLWRWVGTAALLGGLALHVNVVMEPFWRADGLIAQMRAQAAQTITPGSRVLPVMIPPRPGVLSPQLKAFWHTAAYFVLDEDVFYPLLFSDYSVKIQPEYHDMSAPASIPVPLQALDMPANYPQQIIVGEPNYWVNWQRNFDFILLYHFGQSVDLSRPSLTLVGQGAIFSIYRINHDAPAGPGAATGGGDSN
jgi:hypothetical protein